MKPKTTAGILLLSTMAAAGSIASGGAGQPQVHPFAAKRLVYQVPGMNDVVKKPGIVYHAEEGEDLELDLFLPPGPVKEAKLPLVVLVSGYPDPAIKKYYGVGQKDLGLFSSWAELIAASGMAAVTYESERSAAETGRVIAFLKKNAAGNGIDPDRIALFGCSANTLTAQALMQEPGSKIKCAVFYYPILATPDKKTDNIIADSAKRYGFYWEDLKEIVRIPKEIPLFVVSAGKESHSEVEATTKHFIGEAMALGVPLTYVHYADGQHDFDVLDDTPEARAIIRQTVDFLKLHLLEGK